MDRCPELFELETFFEVPAVSTYGNDGGWFYDNLSFTRPHSEGSVVCHIEPVERAFSICHTTNQRVVLDISLQYVCSLEIEGSADAERLIGRISHGGVEQLFKVAFKPEFSFHLGTAFPAIE